MSGIHDAMQQCGDPEPALEDTVNVFCPDCCAEYNSHPFGLGYGSGSAGAVKFIKFVGNDNCELYLDDDDIVKERITCPQGCETCGEPTEMLRFDETGNFTPWDLWDAAQKASEIYGLTSKLEALEKAYNHKGYQRAYSI